MNTRTTVTSPLVHRISMALACCAVLAGCGGGGSHVSLPPAIPGSGLGPSAVGSAPATFVFTFPKPSTASARLRTPKYLSSATASVSLLLTDTKNHFDSTDIFASVPAALKVQQNFNPSGTNGSPTTPGQCGADPGNANNIECTVVFQLPVGDNTLTISSHDAINGGGNLLSQQKTTVWTKQGVANTYSVSLDAQAATIVTTAASPTTWFAGPIGGATIANGAQLAIISPPLSGSNSQTFNVSLKDAKNKQIVAPGMPVMAVTTAGNTDITVSNVVQGNGTTTPYSFTLTASASTASVASTTPTDVTVKFTGANAPADGISLVSETFHVSNGKLLAVSGGTPSQINLYVYGDGQLVQFGSTITSAGSLGGHGASEVQFDNAENLYVADFGNGSASAVFKIPRANLQNATPAATQITPPAGNPKKLEPWYMNFMDVAGDGTITVAQNSNNFSDPVGCSSCTPPVSPGTMATMPDTILVAAAGSNTFTLGWNNIGTTGFSSGCQCLGAAMSIAALTNSGHTSAFGAAAPSFTGPQTPGPNGYVAIVYFANTAGTTPVQCDNASGTTTTCYEADSTSNADYIQNSWTVWDYVNQKLVTATDDSANNFFKLLDFPATAGVVSTTSTVLDTVSLGTNSGFPYPMAVSRFGRLSSQYVYTGSSPGQRVNVYDNNSGTKVVNGLADTPTIGGGSSMAGTGFVSDATTDALVVVGKDASSNNVLRVYNLASSRLASFPLPFAPLDLGLAAQSHSQRAVRRGQRGSSL